MPSIDDYAERDARIVTMQAELLDYSGHVRRGLTRGDVARRITEINELRAANHWQPLNMTGRWRRT